MSVDRVAWLRGRGDRGPPELEGLRRRRREARDCASTFDRLLKGETVTAYLSASELSLMDNDVLPLRQWPWLIDSH